MNRGPIYDQIWIVIWTKKICYKLFIHSSDLAWGNKNCSYKNIYKYLIKFWFYKTIYSILVCRRYFFLHRKASDSDFVWDLVNLPVHYRDQQNNQDSWHGNHTWLIQQLFVFIPKSYLILIGGNGITLDLSQ